jgi:hypothetical protein
MNTEEVLRGLRYEQKKRENDFVGTCQTDISAMCKDCADCIESLQTQLKEEVSRRYQAECNYDHAVADRDRLREWIPVSERLPEKPEYDWVLVATKMDPEGWYGVPHVAELRDGKWFAQGDDKPLEEWCAVKVTHWMPLPENPIV